MSESSYWQNRTSRRAFVRMATLGSGGVAAAFALACSGGSSKSTSSQAQPSGPQQAATQAGQAQGTPSQQGAAPQQRPGESKPKYGGVLNMSFLVWTEPPISGLNLHTAVDFFNLVLNRVVYQNPKTLEVIPELAESWEQLDPTTLVIKVRQGVKYHDLPPANGREFDSEDMITSFKNNAGLLDDPKNVPLYSRRATYAAVDHYEAVDKNTVKIVFSQPFSPFIAGNADILLYTVAKEQWSVGWDPLKILGTGPYLLKSIEGQHVKATYVRNPNYWEKAGQDQLPYLDGFNQDNIADRSTWIGAFAAGKTDFFMTPSKDERATLRKIAPNALYDKYKGSQYFPLFLSGNKAPFNDVRVRKAIQLALDVKALNDAWFGPEDRDWYYVGTMATHFPEAIQPDELATMPGLNPATKAQDTQQAKQLMTAAGFPDGGIQWTISLSASTGRAYEYAVRIKDQLQKIWPAMKLDLPVLDPATAGKNFTTGAWQAGFGGEQSEVDPIMELYRYYHPKGVRNVQTFFSNDRVTSLIGAGIKEFDNAKRKAMIRQIQDLVFQEMPVVPLALPTDGTFSNPKVQGYVGRTGPALSIGSHTVAQLSKDVWLKA